LKAAGQGCRARLPGKAAGQGLKAAGQGCRARLPGKAARQLAEVMAARFFSFAKVEKSLLQRNPAHMTRPNEALDGTSRDATCFMVYLIR
jgi:hypothetical protein